MQSTRWKDNNPMMTSKALLRKRAGSLSEEKIAQIRQEMFEYDLSSNSSPRTYHLKTLLSPESLPSTEATIQTYNEQYYHSQNRLRVSSKLSNQTSGEKGYPELSPVPYNASYNHGAEPHGLTPSRRPHGNKGNQLASALDLEALMPAEAKRLCSDLEQLSSEERKIAMIVDEATFSAKIQQEIDCVGCVSSLHTYLYELSELAKNKPGSVLHFEGFVVYGDRRIGFSEEKIGDIHNIAYILHHHKSKNSIIDELTRSLNIKKHDGHTRGKVLSRCLLHSKKPMPNEHDINEVASVAELDEPSFVTSLQMHTKRRKFCSTCRDNIMFVYDNMLEEASNCSDCEEGVDDEDDEEEEEEEVSEENGEEAPIEAPELDHKTSTTVPEAMTVQQNRPSATGTSDYETVSEPNENGNSRGSEQSRVISYTRKTPGSLLACIKYCPERRKLAIPLEMEIFMEFLSKADTGTTMHTKHANTKEAAQEELIACIGTCLKERLQNIWRTKKSEELARILFMKLVADCVVDGITQKLEEKNYKLGHKTILEEYLNETEAAQQQKKEKLRQKRLKRKEKKKKLQTDGIDPEDAGDEQEPENEVIESKEELKEAQTEINTIKEMKENKEIEEVNNNKGKKEKKKKKGKNTAQSPPHDKTSTDSQTPETKKSVDKGSGAGKKNRKEVEEEEKLERKKRSDDVGSVRNNRFAACDERERRLLMSMGWTEETSEVEGIVDEKEVKKLKEKWKEIEASRADFRKNAKEKFMQLLYSK